MRITPILIILASATPATASDTSTRDELCKKIFAYRGDAQSVRLLSVCLKGAGRTGTNNDLVFFEALQKGWQERRSATGQKCTDFAPIKSPETECMAAVVAYEYGVSARDDFEKQKADAATRSEQRKRDAERRAEASKPENILSLAYAAYIDLKKCHRARDGYADIYVTDQELDRAKRAAGDVEAAIAGKLGAGLGKEAFWRRAEQDRADAFHADGEFDIAKRRACQRTLAVLLDLRDRHAPQADRVEKDF